MLKDAWVDSERTREGEILSALYETANVEDKVLVRRHFLTTFCHGEVLTEMNIVDDTANTPMRVLNITVYPDLGHYYSESLYNLRKLIKKYKPKTLQDRFSGERQASRLPEHPPRGYESP